MNIWKKMHFSSFFFSTIFFDSKKIKIDNNHYAALLNNV